MLGKWLVGALLPAGRQAARPGWLLATALFLSACSGAGFSTNEMFGSSQPPPAVDGAQTAAIGNGEVKVGLILPLSATGNAGIAAKSMRNSAEMALAEF